MYVLLKVAYIHLFIYTLLNYSKSEGYRGKPSGSKAWSHPEHRDLTGVEKSL